MSHQFSNEISEASQHWIASAKQHASNLNIELLTKACLFAENITDQTKVPFAESSLSEGLTMATKLLELNCDSETLAAAITYPGIYYNRIAFELVDEKLGQRIHKLVAGAQRMEAIHDISQLAGQAHASTKQVENLRKMLLAMVDDVRVVLIKLAERLSMLTYLRHCPREQQLAIARQTIHIYAPLANRLGIGQIKWQMEDLSFRYLNPDEYQKISKALNMRRADRDSFINEMTNKLKTLFQDAHIHEMDISGRAKHIYSIYRKMQKKRVDFSEIYDTIAFRIIVPSIKDCYTALGIVHSTWAHISREFDDYIAKPKPNGYQSIHTVVVGPEKISVEIQIRTQKMHEEAELGVAAHWKYKEGATEEGSNYENKITWLREIMDWQKELTTEKPGGENLYSKIFNDRIYVFTPNSEIYDLPAGATPLDFAYYLHSELGHRCRGAKVNEALVPLTYSLKTGDRVQILTTKKDEPSRDWLNPHLGYLNTALARNKVRHWFRKQNYQQHLTAGEEIWDKVARREKISKAKLNKIAPELNFKNSDDLLVALGAGDITITHILHHLKEEEASGLPPTERIPEKMPSAPSKSARSHLHISGIGNLLTQLGRCCKPIPGDEILGYITKGRGITIHQLRCQNLQQAKALFPERIVEVDWGEKKNISYPVDLMIEASDRPALIRDITSVIANENIPIVGIHTHLDKAQNMAVINLTIEIKTLDPLHRILNQLKSVPDVARVIRV